MLRRSWLDVWAGSHHFSPSDFPSGVSWEAALGTMDLNIFNLIPFFCNSLLLSKVSCHASIVRSICFFDGYHLHDTRDLSVQISWVGGGLIGRKVKEAGGRGSPRGENPAPPPAGAGLGVTRAGFHRSPGHPEAFVWFSTHPPQTSTSCLFSCVCVCVLKYT